MSSPLVPFDWQQVDQALANLMLLEVSLEIRELIREDQQQIHFLNIGNENSATSPSQRLDMQILRTDEWAARTYETYLEIWLCQQEALSPHFLRAICQHGIRTLTSARAGSVTSEFAMEQARTNQYRPEWLKTITTSFGRKMELLFGKWQRLAEIDARSVEYALRANSPLGGNAIIPIIHARTRTRLYEARIASVVARMVAAESALSAMKVRTPDAYRTSLIEQSLASLKADKADFKQECEDWQVRLRAALAQTPDTSQLHGQAQSAEDFNTAKTQSRPSSKVKYASGLKRTIALLLSITPNASDLQICRHLDEDGAVELPPTWKSEENRLFELAYKDPKHRPKVEKMISKVRTEMRKKGLLD